MSETRYGGEHHLNCRCVVCERAILLREQAAKRLADSVSFEPRYTLAEIEEAYRRAQGKDVFHPVYLSDLRAALQSKPAKP